MRPKRNWLEICVFLDRAMKAPQVRRVDRSSANRLVHFLRITHRDEVEPPITDWLQRAYELNGLPPGARTVKPSRRKTVRRRTRRA